MIFNRKGAQIFCAFFIFFSIQLFSQQRTSFTLDYEVNENNPLIFEKSQAELFAKNEYRSQSLGDMISSINQITQSAISGSSSKIVTKSRGRGKFVKSKKSKFDYIPQGDRLFIRVTVYGRILPMKELADIDVKILRDNSLSQEHLFSNFYTIKEGDKIVPYVRSTKKVFVSIFYSNNKKVDLHVPYEASSSNYNIEVRADRDYYFNFLPNETIKTKLPKDGSVVAYDNMYFVFSLEPFSYSLGNSEWPMFSKEEFDKMLEKWYSSDSFQLFEYDIIIEN